MEMAVVVALHAIMLLYANAVASATAFYCKNSLITDEWREMVLDRHNKLRQRLANGQQKGSAGMLKNAADMNKLNWDCNMEMLVDEKITACNENGVAPANPAYGVAKEMVRIGSGSCNATILTRDTLDKWWKEGAAKQADATVTEENAFSQMALAKSFGFACSYRRCSGKLFLVCFYNQKATNQQALYVEAQATTCDDCAKYPVGSQTKVPCEAFLCQYPLDPAATVDLQVCNQCPGTFSDYFRLSALNTHNYYRRLLATGWAKNGVKYAPTATQMLELEYDKDLEEKANNHVTNANCPSAAEGGPEGENFWMTTNFNTPYEDAIKMAMEEWWKPFENEGFGNDLTYTNAIKDGPLKYSANILHDKTTKMGCAVQKCQKEGRLVLDCRYSDAVQQGDPIYAAGKVCSKCKETPTPSCSRLGGLCVAQP